MRLLAALAAALLLALPARAEEPPIFDAHLHYNDVAVAKYPVADVLALFQRNNVRGILANSRPNDGTHLLLEAGAQSNGALWVVPFFRPYRTRADMQDWWRNPEILAWIEEAVAHGTYRGIGEFHLHGAENAAHPQVKAIVGLAQARGLWLHAHSDENAVEQLFAHEARSKVVWAHTGFGTSPEKVEAMLKAYPGLICELSYRSGITGGDGQLSAEWRRLFETYTERFVLGSDTWVNERWESYSQIMDGYRAWLKQLPADTARRIAFGNAETLFGGR